MQIINIPTEQTTAATDAILAIFAIGAIVYLNHIAMQDPLKMKIWSGLFASAAMAAALGSVVHGLVISSEAKRFLWQPLALSLAISVGVLAVGTAYDLWGVVAAQRILPVMVILILVLYALAKLTSIGMILNIFFVAGVLFFALGAYTVQAIRGQLEGAWLMATGLLLTVCAGIIQTRHAVSFKFIWEFDHNGIFHLIQLLALFLLVLGLRKSFL